MSDSEFSVSVFQGAHIDVRKLEPLPNVATGGNVDMSAFQAATLTWSGKTYHLDPNYSIIRPSRDGGMEQRSRDSNEWVPCKEVEA